jgi:hypothetical protein
MDRAISDIAGAHLLAHTFLLHQTWRIQKDGILFCCELSPSTVRLRWLSWHLSPLD